MLTVVIIGLFVGAVLGLTGAGGSIFAVPLLILFLDFESYDAMGLALGAVAVSSAYGSFLQRHLIFWLPSMVLIIGGVMAAPLGKWMSIYVTQEWLLAGFTFVALVISAKMFRDAQVNPEHSAVTRLSRVDDSVPNNYLCRLSSTGQFQLKPRCLSSLVLGGLFIGFVSGFFGVGGGFLIVPLLLFLGQVHISRAIACSLLVISFISSSGFISYLFLSDHFSDGQLLGNQPEGTTFFALLGGSLAGMLMSRPLSHKLAGPTLQKTFAVMLIIISVFTVVKTFI